MPKAPPPARVGRRQADPPPTPDAPARAKTGPRALPLALLVPIDQIEPDPDQPRTDHGDESLAALADSLTDYGVLQPLLVRDAGERDNGQTRYIIIAGGRRYAAALLAGLPRLPVVVRDTEGATLRLTQLVENIQRQDLAPLEEARAFKELMDAEGVSAETVGARLHVSGQRVRDRLLLLTNQRVADAVQRDQIPVTVATEILRLPAEGQQQLGPRIDAGEALDRATVRAVRDTLKDAGVVNPRAKGGGRPKSARQTMPVGALANPPTATADATDQCGIDNGETRQRLIVAPDARVDPRERLRAALGSVNAAIDVARVGADEGWTCKQLVTELTDVARETRG